MPELSLKTTLDTITDTQEAILGEKDLGGILRATEEQLAMLGYEEITIALVIKEGSKYFLKSFKETIRSKNRKIVSSEGSYLEKLAIGKGIGALSVLNNKAYHITDPNNDPRVNKKQFKHDVTEYYTTPLIVRDPVEPIEINGKKINRIGVLNVRYKNPEKHFSEVDRRYIDVIAGILANAIDNSRSHNKLKDMADHDGLTGLFNHRYFRERLEEETDRATRYKRELSLIMLDIDYFKIYNDILGHLAGDYALKDVASIISKEIRTTDIAARYGGEEFAIIMPETGCDSLKTLTKRIREEIQNHFSVSIGNNEEKIIEGIKGKLKNPSEEDVRETIKKLKLTVSMGVCQYRRGVYKEGRQVEPSENLDDFIGRTDSLLYKAKGKGRNCICIENKP